MNFASKLISIGFSNDKVPAFVEQRGKEWIKYGEENNYPEFLLTLFNRSAIHNSILTSKQFYIAGKGFDFDQKDMQTKDISNLKAFIDNPNPDETLNDILNKTVLDEELFGGFYLHGINNKKGEFNSIYLLDYCTVRSNTDNSLFFVEELDEDGKGGWVSNDGTENYKPKYKTIEAYDPNKKQKEFVYYYKSYRPNLKSYTLPSYIGGVEAIITDCEIANFHRAEIQNSFKGSKMIVFKNGVPSDDEMKATERKLKAKFTPTDNAGAFVIDFVDDPARTPEIMNLGDDQFDKKYDALDKTIEGKIFKSHKITSPILFGVTTPGALGQRNELVDAYNIFQNTYIKPKQAIQLAVFEKFAPVKGKLNIIPTEPILPTYGDAVLQSIMTVDELRGKIGLKPIMGGDQLPSGVQPIAPAEPILAPIKAYKFSNEQIDELDLEVFMKYGEPIEMFTSIKAKRLIFSVQEFGKLNEMEQAILDLIKKTPDITEESLSNILKVDKTIVTDALETLSGEGLINVTDKGINTTSEGDSKKVPSFQDLMIRYKYVERPDAPALVKGGESREFCKAMIANPRYFSKQDIDMIGEELGQLYGIANYDAFRRRGGWYHDPKSNVNVPFCRHAWQQELVKKIK
ncbi:MAG: hypothetical protein WCP61_08860 [Chitinophagia bacterium]